MSLKYERVKKADLKLPTALRWLTRAFSSITMAVCLLACIALYGLIASVPIAFLAKGLLYASVVLGGMGVGAVSAIQIMRRRGVRRTPVGTSVLIIVLILGGSVISIWGWRAVNTWAQQSQWFDRHHATVIYRLPYFEMTELEFYSWWPLRAILGLFVCNMVWATIRRIEFKWINIGVLTVHTGIVLIAIGSIAYGFYKVEGDTILWRRDLGGEPVAHYYDQTTPAIFFLNAKAQPLLMLSLADLPRYNDYNPNRHELDIRLHESPAFRSVFGDHLRATIRGFISYGTLEPQWVGSDPSVDVENTAQATNPALRLGFGDEHGPREGFDTVLVANIPDARVIDQPTWAIEYLVDPSPQRIKDLMSEFTGDYGLVVKINTDNSASTGQTPFRAIYPITHGQSIVVGDTGYKITIEAIGDYGMPFVSEGYKRARDTRALIKVEHGDRSFRRIVFHRYPTRNQDFVPVPNDPNVGPMGRRTDPDPAIQLSFIDASKLQYRLITSSTDNSKLQLLAHVPGVAPVLVEMSQNRLPVIGTDRRQWWVFLTEQLPHAVQKQVPVITPKNQRQPKDEGTYLHALLPIDLEITVPEDANRMAWHERFWLTHMRYPKYPDIDHRPVKVRLPSNLPSSRAGDTIMIAFSRLEEPLPFALTLEDFQMQPYPGTQIPRDYIAKLGILENTRDRQPTTQMAYGQARLNNPLVRQGMKISQTGWDPGDRTDPDHQAKNDQGKLINQQRFTILGIGNNVGIRVIFVGACFVVVGIPWAFYVKPLLIQRQKRRIQQRHKNYVTNT